MDSEKQKERYRSAIFLLVALAGAFLGLVGVPGGVGGWDQATVDVVGRIEGKICGIHRRWNRMAGKIATGIIQHSWDCY